MSIVERAIEELRPAARAGAPSPAPDAADATSAAVAVADEAAIAVGAQGRSSRPDDNMRDPLERAAKAVNATRPPVADQRPHAAPSSARRRAEPLPPLDITPAWLAQHHFIAPGSGRTSIAEDFRRIKRQLLAGATGAAPARRILVTSALPGEGKTYCAINLALGIAMELRRSVVLVDADTVRPSVLSQLGQPADMPGLLDALADGETHIDDVIRTTNIDNFQVLPAGAERPNATELLASDGMRGLADTLSHGDERIAIFDSAPLLLASETAALAAHMTQVLIVVAAGQTTESTLREALKRLDGCRCPIATILNKGETAAEYGLYGYGNRFDARYGVPR